MIVIAIEDVNGIKALIAFGDRVRINDNDEGRVVSAYLDEHENAAYLSIRTALGRLVTYQTKVVTSLEVLG